MNVRRLSLAVLVVFGAGIVDASAMALNLYVDTKTSQVFTSPGAGRVKLGSFQQIDETKSPAAAEGQKLATASEVKQVEEKLNQRIDSVANKPKKPNEAKTQIDDKGIRFETNDGNFKFSMNGRLHTDADMFSGGDIVTYSDRNDDGRYNPATDGPVQNNRLTDGTEIRRFRMEFAGQFYKDWHFKMQPEIANGGGNGTVGIRDAFVQYKGFDWGNFVVGQSKQPYSFQQMMSSNDMVFMERSTEYEFTNRSVNRAIGLRYDLGGDWWGFSTGVYGDTATRQTSGTTTVDDEGWGGALRATLAPWYNKSDELLHIGASGAFRAPPSGQRTVRYAIAPTAISQFAYLDTGNMPDVQNSEFVDGEMVGIYGPLSFETEYNATWLNANDVESTHQLPAGNGFFQGAHVDVAYSLTGESRGSGYRADQGVLGRIKPEHNLDFHDGWGAFELKGRFMWVDMNQIADSATYGGGSQVASTFGGNWYFNNWARFMLDWTHVYSLNVGRAGVNRTVLDIPGNTTGDWDYVQARIDLHY